MSRASGLISRIFRGLLASRQQNTRLVGEDHLGNRYYEKDPGWLSLTHRSRRIFFSALITNMILIKLIISSASSQVGPRRLQKKTLRIYGRRGWGNDILNNAYLHSYTMVSRIQSYHTTTPSHSQQQSHTPHVYVTSSFRQWQWGWGELYTHNPNSLHSPELAVL